MDKLEALKRTLTYHGSDSVCLWFSGGADSRLLLEVLIELGKPFGVLRFDEGWNREQKRQVDAVILKHRLQAFSYPALDNLLVGEDENVSLVSKYSIDAEGRSVVLIRDVVDGDKSVNSIKLEKPRTSAAPIEYEIHIWGTRSEDRHYIMGEKPLTNFYDFPIGKKRILYPLLDWTREEVTKALLRRGIDLSNDLDLDIHADHSTLGEWDPQHNLSLVRAALAA